ncbi:uncharacterized protein LOC120625565 [Pararge aegeria]|uniref:uncharacterized protein LOC120625565 n=1 Tax=Pararge aegeria TaxID=116150 RepID=UPI0019D0120A|nr:uncharacterized protein LOC120625565 [Pararge aegeria]
MVYNSELRPETENSYGYADRNAHINIRSNIFQCSNNIISKQRQIMTPIPRNLPNTDVYFTQNPVKHIMQGLQALESTKIEPVLNPYYVKIPRVHLNNAHSRQIAHGQKKALENGNLKRIHLNKHKHKFVPDIDVLLYQKSFLFPDKSFITNRSKPTTL